MDFIISRIKEPSTWAGVSAFVVGVHLLPADSPIVAQLPAIGIAIGGILAAFLPEKKS